VGVLPRAVATGAGTQMAVVGVAPGGSIDGTCPTADGRCVSGGSCR
jgi:hypothetical protein